MKFNIEPVHINCLIFKLSFTEIYLLEKFYFQDEKSPQIQVVIQ